MARSAPTFRRYIKSIAITNAGQNYSSIPGDTIVFIEAPEGAPESNPTQATATVDIQNGSVAVITITEPGDGYANTPQVYIQSGLNTGTSALTFTGTANSERDAGTYPDLPVISNKAGFGATATVTIDSNGNVTSVDVTASGGVYMEGETVIIQGISIGGDSNASDMTFTVSQLKGGGNGAILTPEVDVIAAGVEYKHDSMNYVVDSQIPNFVNEEYPNLSKFIKDYYKFLDLGPDEYDDLGLASHDSDKNQSANYLLEEMIDNLNIDHENPSFLDAFLEQYAIDFPKTAEINSQDLIKKLQDFLEAKGSRRGVELFFRLIFNEEVDVVLPSEFILKPSDGVWQNEVTVKVYGSTEIIPNGDPFTLRGKKVDIVYYTSTASITSRNRINTSVSRVKKIAYTAPEAFELSIDIPANTIIPGPGVEGDLTAVIGGRIATVGTIGAADGLRAAGSYDINSGFTTDGNGTGAQFTVVVNGSGAATITVDAVGDNYAPDETITIPDSLLGGGGAAALTFKVATITNGKIFSVTISDAGKGYSANPVVVIDPHPDDTITTEAVIATRLTDGSITNTVFVNNVQGLGYNKVPTVFLDTDSVRTWIGFENATDVSSNKIAFLTRVLNDAVLKTNSGAANGGFSVGDTFLISETGDILGVYAIDYFAEDYTITGISNNALVRVKSVDSSNYPAGVEVISTGTGFARSSFDFILRSSNDETTTITCSTGFSHTYPGAHKNVRGFLSDANRLQDNAVYQNFAYQVRTSRPKTEWGELMDRIAHPAGMIAWTDLQINQTINMGDDFAATPDVIVFRLFAEVETPAATEATALFFHKPAITDSVELADPKSLEPNLIKTETTPATDALDKFDVVLNKTESPDVNDAPSLSPHKPAITDSVEMSEVVETLKFLFRSPTETVDWAETVIRVSELTKTDSIDMSEAVAKAAEIIKTDGFEFQDAVDKFDVGTDYTESPSATDSQSFDTGAAATDSAEMGEGGVLTSTDDNLFLFAQNYISGDYFAEDYVGVARYEADMIKS